MPAYGKALTQMRAKPVRVFRLDRLRCLTVVAAPEEWPSHTRERWALLGFHRIRRRK